MKEELARECAEHWLAFGQKTYLSEAARRRAIGRLYYGVLTAGRERFGASLSKGYKAHFMFRVRASSVAKELEELPAATRLLSDLSELQALRVRSDYHFHDHVSKTDHGEAIALAAEIMEELRHSRWDAAARINNPPADMGAHFLDALERLRERFAAATARFEEAVEQWNNDAQSYNTLRALYRSVKQPYLQFWYVTLDFVQSDAVEPAAAMHALDELDAASDVYFAVRGVFFEHVQQYFDPEGARVLGAHQAEMFGA